MRYLFRIPDQRSHLVRCFLLSFPWNGVTVFWRVLSAATAVQAWLLYCFLFFLLKRCFPFTMSCRDLTIEHFGNGDSSSFMRKRLVMLERKTGLITFHERILGYQVFAFVNQWRWDVMYSELVKWCAGLCLMLLFSKGLLTHCAGFLNFQAVYPCSAVPNGQGYYWKKKKKKARAA